MKITRTKLSELIRDEIENFKPVTEKIKISKGHGRGQSWTNYHDDNDNRLQVTKVGNEYTAYFSKAGVSGSKNSVLLRGLSKTDAAKLVKLAKSSGIEKTAKHGKSKYKKYVSEGKKIVVNTDKGRKIQLDIDAEAKAFINGLKKDKKELTPKNISNYIDAEYKFFNSPKLNQQVFNYIKKNLKSLSEAKDIHHSQAKALQVPKRHIKKLEKLLTKKYPPKSGQTRVEFDTKPVRVPGFIKITTDKHIYDDVVELLIKLGIKVR